MAQVSVVGPDGGESAGETTVILSTFTPDLYVEYFRDLRGMIAGGRPLTAGATVEAVSRYATEPATGFA